MAFIKFSPYVPNIQAWVDFYENQPKEYKSFYTIGSTKRKGEKLESVKLISPTEAVVDRARSEIKRQEEVDNTDKNRERGDECFKRGRRRQKLRKNKDILTPVERRSDKKFKRKRFTRHIDNL